ncbi:MAG TPA: glycosyltransferase [Thermoleophilaceae bacterium]|nr:glycosyltransferase [Thermoleophilaceae bacterium]
MPPEIAAVVAARNEEERLPGTLVALRSAFPAVRLIVADDASTDHTPEIAREAGAELMRGEKRLGKGGAMTPAAGLALDPEPRAVLLCDGDLGESAAHLARLVGAVESGEADLAIARFARRVGGGFGIALTSSRQTVERRTGRRLEAPLSGQRALTPAALKAVLPFAPGFGMETAMNIDALRAGLTVAEIELDLEHRATGRTAAGFAHRGRQLADIARVYLSRR